MTPAEILDIHADAADQMRVPSWSLGNFVRQYMNDQDGIPHPKESVYYPVRGVHGHYEHKDALAFCKVLGLALMNAPTYEVTPEFVRAAQEIRVDEERLHVLGSEELPGPSGFIWLDIPWFREGSLDLPGGTPQPEQWDYYVRALSWSTSVVPLRGGRTAEAIRLVLWNTLDDELALGKISTVPAKAKEDIINPGQQVGESQYDYLRREGPALYMVFTDFLPLDQQLRAGEGAAISTPKMLRFIHSLWMLLGTTIARTEPAPVPRATRRRASRVLAHPEIRVVTLRRLSADSDSEKNGHHPVDWSCRWLVQGHYRHIRKSDQHPGHRVTPTRDKKSCIACGMAITRFIKPFIKGPDGAELKLAETPVLYRLKR